MKNLFCQTYEALTEKITGEVPNSARVETVNNGLNEKAKGAEETIEKIKKRKKIITMIASVVNSLMILLVFLPIFGLVMENKGEQIAACVLLILTFVSSISIFAFLIYIWKKYKKEETKQAQNELDSIKASIFESYGVPINARKIDLLTDMVSNKGKRSKIYRNNEYLVYKRGENLYFATRYALYSFPISSIKNVHISDKLEEYHGWNKDISDDDSIYSDSIKIKRGQKGTVWKYMKNSHHVEIELGGEEYEIIVPRYDFLEFERIYNEY